ncbi:GGDEF domain-containing protein [Nocardia sp. NPDC058518]|uniref:GGDEF domain-containing protein n=1 Tax=Nocardia sp. NPDC058518 TaxID=3346534 RepID=UPI00365D9F5E
MNNILDELPCKAGWLTGARSDPITGLVAFPDLYPRAVVDALDSAAAEHTLFGLAIGDVDDLKIHVEHTNATDPDSFGHLAGNALMTELGAVCREWFADTELPAGCVSTFGGDEVIIVATGITERGFTDSVTDLRDRCRDALPCTVSFASTVVGPGLVWPSKDPAVRAKFLLAAVDRALFAAKASRRAARGPAGAVVTVDLAQAVRDAA